jgi:hypothetical protein
MKVNLWYKSRRHHRSINADCNMGCSNLLGFMKKRKVRNYFCMRDNFEIDKKCNNPMSLAVNGR